jgi:hypothetical protein
LAPQRIALKQSIDPDFGTAADRPGVMPPGDPVHQERPKSPKKLGAARASIWHLAICWISAVALFTGFELLSFERQADGPQP